MINDKNMPAKGGSASGGKKILIVEDEQDLRDALLDKLGREGFDAQGAANGKEGLELALKEHPDLIVALIIVL